VTIGPNRQWKWVKGETKQRKYRPRGQATMWSKRFGYLDTYTYNERKLLICPSGYTFGQGMHALHRLWFAYKSSMSEANIGKMEHYARAIQEVQDDLGLKTSSFPHLGIFGDVLVFRDYKTGEFGEEIDHSELKEKQELEEVKEKFVEETIPLLQPDIEKGETLLAITDEIPAPILEPEPEPEPRYRIKHDNRMHYKKKQKEEYDCRECGERVPAGKSHPCAKDKDKEAEKDAEEKGERMLVFTDIFRLWIVSLVIIRRSRNQNLYPCLLSV
jgi:hypothetical protein